MGKLVFDDETVRKLDAAYRARDIVRRRELVHAAVEASPGERILDVGCGPSFFVSEFLARVGETGSVTGVDQSPEMLAVAAHRCSAYGNVVLRAGKATALPVDDGAFDAGVAVQVLEYVDDVDAALQELHRAVRPGGRVVVWDVDWTTLSWHSADPARMDRVLGVWDRHLAHPALPRTLGGRLRRTGFADVRVSGHPFVADELSPETYVGATFPIVREYAAAAGDPGDAESWAAEQHELSAAGAFFFAVTQFCFTATRP